MQPELFVGLMSGTSLDGIDAVLVSFDADQHSANVHATREFEFPAPLRNTLQEVIANPGRISQQELKSLDAELGRLYGQCVKSLLADTHTLANDIVAIGCHGQTIDHQPDASPPFSVQLGDGATIAKLTGITTVNDFRRADIELGGQGAPLAPAFHEWAFAQAGSASIVINIGGIANITLLAENASLLGYDTGPGNTLLDQWAQQHLDKRYDANGDWARNGQLHNPLLEQLLADPYFSRTAPKSTGREYFNPAWLEQTLSDFNASLNPQDVQRTLTELTASSIATAVMHHSAARVWVCGGGAHNDFLLERLAANLGAIPLQTTGVLGIEPDWVEAIAFAWLARARLGNIKAGRPSVTGAREAGLLGTIHSVGKL